MSRLTTPIQPISFPNITFDSNSPLPLDQTTLDRLLDLIFQKQDNKEKDTIDRMKTATIIDDNSGPGRSVKHKKSTDIQDDQVPSKDGLTKFEVRLLFCD